MPRQSDGSYSPPSGTLVNTGDTILVSQHNPFVQDASQALTDSIDRNGAGGMLADLNMNSHKITNLAPGTGPSDAATVSQLSGGSTGLPVGAIVDYAGPTPPVGWLLCSGQSVSRATYADLFEAIGTTYGSINGSSFNVPDLRGRVTAGRDESQGRLTSATMSPDGNSLGATGGAQTQTLTEAQLASHTHAVSGTTSSAGAHVHSYVGGTATAVDGVGSELVVANSSTSDTSSAGTHTHSLTGTATSAGSDQAHPNVQPTIVLNKIIKATL